jgi:hypothetical protein
MIRPQGWRSSTDLSRCQAHLHACQELRIYELAEKRLGLGFLQISQLRGHPALGSETQRRLRRQAPFRGRAHVLCVHRMYGRRAPVRLSARVPWNEYRSALSKCIIQCQSSVAFQDIEGFVHPKMSVDRNACAEGDLLVPKARPSLRSLGHYSVKLVRRVVCLMLRHSLGPAPHNSLARSDILRLCRPMNMNSSKYWSVISACWIAC